jgi:hypothetical protein
MNNTDFVKSVKINGSVPENQLQFDDQTILDLATEEMYEKMAPFVSLLNSGYLESSLQISIVAGVAGYRISHLSQYGGVKDVWLNTGGNFMSLIPIQETEKTSATGTPHSYYWSGSKIVLYPTPNSSGTLSLAVRLRPAQMTLFANHAIITAIDTALNTLTVSSLPTTIALNSYVDVQSQSSIYEHIQIYNQVTAINTNVLTMGSPISTEISIGDYICPTGTCAFPQIPLELHSTLALMTASRCLGSLGQLDQKAAIDSRIEENLGRFKVVMWPRGRGENEKIVSPYL